MSNRSYSGPPLDLRYQYITERPELRDREDDDEVESETVYATDPEPAGTERVENVPLSRDHQPDRPEPADDADGQTTLADWGRPA